MILTSNFVIKRRNTIIEIVSALFILLFAYTGINKLISIDTLQFVLKDYPLIGGFPNLVAWGLPVTELIVVLFLFIPRTRKIGLYCSLVLMSFFTLYLIYMLIFTPNKPCTCGGMLQQLSWTQHLIFNGAFILLALLALRLSRLRPRDNNHVGVSRAIYT